MFRSEKYNLEFNETITKKFLETVSAFANYNDGEIVFGVNEYGLTAGLEAPEEIILKIEKWISEFLDPLPGYELEIQDLDGKQTITLNVFKGENTPYYYNNMAYRRSNDSTREVDRQELENLAMEGITGDYEENIASKQDLTFKALEGKLKSALDIDSLSTDILKILKLYNKEGNYNIAAQLLADDNNLEYSGIDIVRFGKNINQILYRKTLRNSSILEQYDKALEIFQSYYQYEEINGAECQTKELIPEESFKKELAKAIAHRAWDAKAYIQIAMYDHRVEITSPGGLPRGVSEEEYLSGRVSKPRNPILAGVFDTLNFLVKTLSLTKRPLDQYRDSISRPSCQVYKNSLQIVLPILKMDQSTLTKAQEEVYNLIKDNMELSRREIDEKTGYNKSRTIRLLNSLEGKSVIKRRGKGPGTTYTLK